MKVAVGRGVFVGVKTDVAVGVLVGNGVFVGVKTSVAVGVFVGVGVALLPQVANLKLPIRVRQLNCEDPLG